MEAKNPSSASYHWKSIIKGREVIRRGAIWRIGDGQSVQVWRDNWLPGKNMARILSPCRDKDGDVKVSTFIDSENCRWKEDILDCYLLAFEVDSIKAIPLCRTQQQDTLMWPHNPSSEYTLKSGYKFLQNEHQYQQSGSLNPEAVKHFWQAIWKLNLPAKVKNLVWTACWDSLPSKTNLVKRKVITDAN